MTKRRDVWIFVDISHIRSTVVASLDTAATQLLETKENWLKVSLMGLFLSLWRQSRIRKKNSGRLTILGNNFHTGKAEAVSGWKNFLLLTFLYRV